MKRFWWVNHSQTAEQEVRGGYLWAPKKEANGARSQFYDNMRVANPGDAVLSFSDSRVQFVGEVTEFALSAPKPEEFGTIGSYWGKEGWFLPVSWRPLPRPVAPRAIIERISHLLPAKYSPVHPRTGYGNQKAYLAEIVPELYALIVAKGGLQEELAEATPAYPAFNTVIEQIESALEQGIASDKSLSSTEKERLIKARKGQGEFRRNVAEVERGCRITGVCNHGLLVASHIKPWRSCDSAAERLDRFNGLLMAPHVDMLFDRGLITFSDAGDAMLSSRLPHGYVCGLGLEQALARNVGPFLPEQKRYLAYHRTEVFLA